MHPRREFRNPRAPTPPHFQLTMDIERFPDVDDEVQLHLDSLHDRLQEVQYVTVSAGNIVRRTEELVGIHRAYFQYMISQRGAADTQTSNVVPPDLVYYALTKAESPCSICMQDLEVGDCVPQLPCGHIFHDTCFSGWMRTGKRTCPLCRAAVV